MLLGLLAGVGLFAVLFDVGAAMAFVNRFRCHENGIAQRSLLGINELYFNEIDRLDYDAVNRFYKRIYLGTSLSLTFHPIPGIDKSKIRFKKHLYNASSDDLDFLRDHVAATISESCLFRSMTVTLCSGGLPCCPGKVFSSSIVHSLAAATRISCPLLM